MDTTSTRRAALKFGGGALAYAAGAAAFAVATTATSSCTAKAADRSAWDRAYAEYERTKAAYEAHGKIYDRVDAAQKASAPAEPTEALDQFGYAHPNTVMFKLNLDEALADTNAREGKTLSPDAAQARRDAIEKVRKFRRDYKANLKRHNWSEVSTHNDKLCEAYCAAEDTLIHMPAPHVAALAWKLDKLLVIERDGFTASWSADYVAAAKADAHRLAQMEG